MTVQQVLYETLTDIFAMYGEHSQKFCKETADRIQKELSDRMKDYLMDTNPRYYKQLLFEYKDSKQMRTVMFYPKGDISGMLLAGKTDDEILLTLQQLYN